MTATIPPATRQLLDRALAPIIPPAPEWFRLALEEYREGMKTWRGGPPPVQRWALQPHASKSGLHTLWNADLKSGLQDTLDSDLDPRRPRLPLSPPESRLLTPAQAAAPRRRPSIKKMIAAAERSGKTVTSITTPDGVTLHFGKAEAPEASNPWLDDLKVTKQ